MEKDPSYLASLQALPRVERAQLLEGNWDIRPSAGMYFRRSDFEIVDAAPANVRKKVRAWDLAATKKGDKTDSPDWTVGVLMSVDHNGIYYIEHVERFRENPSKVNAAIKNTAMQDGHNVYIRLPQDPGQAGKAQVNYQIRMLAGYMVKSKPVTGSKETRAKPFASQVEAGNVKLVRGKWNEEFLKELENFPEGVHDDQVDASSDAFEELSSKREARAVI
jgi:predicted phage terminase large subunit-like protein